MSLSEFQAGLEGLRSLGTGTAPLQDVIDAARQLERVWEDAAFVSVEAVGLWIDDLDDPHVAVAVHDGRIVYIGISDGMLRAPMDQLQDTLNACIFNAFGMWRAQISSPVNTAA